MSSLPKSIHWCRRYSTKFNSGWDIPFQHALHASSMPKVFVKRAIAVLGGRDVVENTERPPSQLTLDHKLPMLRWNDRMQAEQTAYNSMDETAILANFQLLKKSNGSVSHNLLKSRACERCYQTDKRGTPFGISFFYVGGPKWARAKKDAAGCLGCGWFDFSKWRISLNRILKGSAK